MKHRDSTPPPFHLHFDPLPGTGPALRFPCDAAGRVDLDQLSDRARLDYLFARAVVGRRFGPPAVRPGIPS
jgi:hypothetical protein